MVRLTSATDGPAATPDRLSGYYQMKVGSLLGQKVKPLDPADCQRVIEQASKLGVEPKLYIAAVLTGHSVTGQNRPFFPSNLVGPTATKRVNLYRSECARRYGYFDGLALEKVSGAVPTETSERFFDSESLAAAYVIGHKMRTMSGSAFDGLYSSRELALDPGWLATEPTYLAWTREHAEVSGEAASHRRRVAKAMKWKETAAEARQAVVIPALEIALYRFGCVKLSDLYGPPVISNPAQMWLKIAEALCRIRDLQILQGDPVPRSGTVEYHT